MKTTLSLATALVLLPLTAAVANSYQATLYPGLTAVANQLDNGDNRLSTIFGASLPAGTTAYKWDVAAQVFTSSLSFGFAWVPDFILSPGEGAILALDEESDSLVFQFNGTPHTPALPLALTPGLFYLISSQTNAPATYEEIVGESPPAGTLVFRLIPGPCPPPCDPYEASERYLVYAFVNGVWHPEAPVAGIGEAVWIVLGCGGDCATNLAPIILMHPKSQTVVGGGTASFTVMAAGGLPLDYQWFRGGLSLANATNSTIEVTNAQLTDAGPYSVVVTNSSGSVTSRTAQLVVLLSDELELLASQITNGSVCLNFSSHAGASYYVEYKDSLDQPLWNTLTVIIGNGGVQTYCEAPLMNSSRFYRLRASTGVTDFSYRYGAPSFVNPIGPSVSGGCNCASPGSPSGTAACGNVQQTAGGNVLLQTGELTQRAVDLEIPGRGFSWRFERAYRSGMNYDGPLGYGWDFNHNRRLLIQNNGDVLRMDGLGRADVYVLTNGTFLAPAGYYTRLTQNGDGTFEERDRDGTRWAYNAPNALHISQLARITDRYANTMTFQYNAMSQLTNVIDTLGLSISYQYDGNGRLIQVKDYLGRAVRFIQDTNADLIAVTSPTVCGAVNRNNFYDGKTTRYSYTSGFVDARLNHKLLTVTAPNEVASNAPPTLVATYETNTNSPNIGRLLSVNLGNGTINYSPMVLGSAASNDFATPVFQNDVTDRNGNQACYQFNQLGNVVAEIHFTRGLRPGEPAGYTNGFEYNRDGEVTRRVEPEGESVEYSYDGTNSDRFQQGNLMTQVRRPGPRGGDQPAITNRMTYETNFNQVATTTDARGNVTQHFYDASGNRIKTIHAITNIVEDFEYNAHGQTTAHVLPDNGSGHRRRDEMTYYTSGPQMGRLHQRIVDAGGLNLTTAYEYDDAGNLVRMIDARGHDTQYVVNELNQVVREISREVTDGSGIRYQRDTYYDANNNVVRMDVQNRDESGEVQTNTAFTTTYEHDSLDNLIRMTQEVAPGTNIVTEYGYDTNRNRILVRYGEATAGRQTNNIVTSVYDERNRLLRETRGGISTTQHDYDLSGNLIRTSEDIEDTNRVRITTYAYDGYNRRIMTTDPMGNVTVNSYDPGGYVTNTAVYGELQDMPWSAGNVRLSETSYTYDAMSRRVRTDVAFFDAQTQAPIGGGQVTTLTLYTPDSQIFVVIDDNGHGTTNTYDSANRLLTRTDAKGNTTSYTYDANNKVVMIVGTDLSDLGNPSQSFTNRTLYDNLDRLIATVDNIGITNRFEYDSRGNRVAAIDGRGNKVRHDYDGLSRLFRTVRFLTDTGYGDGAPAGSITTRQEWDSNSRLTSQIDDNNSATIYVYDALDRQTSTLMADSTSNRLVLSVHGNVVTNTDANGTVLINQYDLLNRLTNRIILRGPGVLGSTNEIYRYDGLSRLVHAQDDVSLVGRAYDSRGCLIRETNNLEAPAFAPAFNKIVATTCDGEGNQISCTYPGGQLVTTRFDQLNRKSAILVNGVTNTSYFYIGDRVEQRRYNNNTWSDYSYDAARRTIAITNYSKVAGVTNTIDARTFAWDANYNKTRRSDVRPGGPQLTQLYTNDSVNRLVGTFVSGPVTNYSRNYRIDGAGNRCNINTNSTNCTYIANLVNAYTTTPSDSRSYDGSGNLIETVGGPSAGTFGYDYRNLLVQAALTSASPATYLYDALGRRVQKTVGVATIRFLYDRWQEIEEQDAAGVTLADYIFGNYVDEPLRMQRGGTNTFFQSDDQWNITSLTDANGYVVERSQYDDYGAVTLLSPSDLPRSQSTLGNPLFFTGRRLDSESGLFYFRARSLDAGVGRFLQRDPIGFSKGINLYAFGEDNPLNSIDPMGTEPCRSECSARNCKWRGHINGSFGGVILMYGGEMDLLAVGVDDSGCSYAVSGVAKRKQANLGLSGAAMGAGYYSVSVDFKDYPAPCQWPVKRGDSATVGLIGVGAAAIPRLSNIATFANVIVGKFDVWDKFAADHGVNLLGGGGAAVLEMVEVNHTGPSPRAR